MCGIHGFIGRAPKRLFEMAMNAANRGPDGFGRYEDRKISLAQNLLSIMDVPSNSKQPWVLPNDEGILCFNGQIYNWPELRIRFGIEMHTQCDTELLAIGLARFGIKFLNELDGMFAIAFYSPTANTLLLARDSSGTKPLYYVDHDNRVTFSSDLRSLRAATPRTGLDQLALSLYFQLGYVPGYRTLFERLSKLMPGEWREYSTAGDGLIAKGRIEIPQSPTTEFKPSLMRGAIRDSVALCAMSMRPMAIYLSGGMDSAAILHEAAELGVPLRSYSTRFVGAGLEKFNEDADLAARLAADYGIEHREVPISVDAFMAAIEQTGDVIDEPRYNRSTPAYYLTTKAIAEDGFVVTLSGDGGDETLAGYPKYNDFNTLLSAGAFETKSGERRAKILSELQNAGRWRWPVPKEIDLTNAVHRWYYMSKFRLEERQITQGMFDPVDLEETLEYLTESLHQVAIGSEPLNVHLNLEQNTWLPEDALIRNDKLGMGFGIEGRFPLTTRKFKSYAMSLNADSKIVRRRLKRCMRWAYENTLPDYIVRRKSKTGWAAPVLNWAQSNVEFSKLLQDSLMQLKQGALGSYVDVDSIVEIGEPKLQYSAFYLQIWAERWGL